MKLIKFFEQIATFFLSTVPKTIFDDISKIILTFIAIFTTLFKSIGDFLMSFVTLITSIFTLIQNFFQIVGLIFS